VESKREQCTAGARQGGGETAGPFQRKKKGPRGNQRERSAAQRTEDTYGRRQRSENSGAVDRNTLSSGWRMQKMQIKPPRESKRREDRGKQTGGAMQRSQKKLRSDNRATMAKWPQ